MSSPRLTILVKLIVAYVVPAVVFSGVFAAMAHDVARRDLEAELGARVAAVAAAAATQLRDPSLARLGPGNEHDVRYRRCQSRLRDVATATGVARIYVFDRSLASVCDTAADIAIGEVYYHLEADAIELARVFEHGVSTSSILFEDANGRSYKPGYAPVVFDGPIVLALGVDAAPRYFVRLDALRRSLVLYGAAFALAVLVASIIVATLITRPVRGLVMSAARIGRGDLGTPILRPARDELGLLAQTMEAMRTDLLARDERMQLMLSGIAHEVRNPLGGIALFAGILREELAGDPEKLAHVQRIEREMMHLKTVVAQFLDYARRDKTERAPVDVAAIVTDVAKLCEAEAQSANVTLAVDAVTAPSNADAVQLRRAVLNLVRNAIEAAVGSDGARVHITSYQDGDQSVIKVGNTGPAIEPEVLARMFEPFYTTKEQGTGLGLAFVREIVLDHDGSVDIDSDSQRGTVFTLRLGVSPGFDAAS